MRLLRSFVAVAAAASLALPASATNGFFGFGYSTKSKGMGGAGVALPSDSLCLATNPAGLVDVGTRVDAGIGAYFFRPEYTAEGAPSGAPGTMGMVPGTVEAEDKTTIAPIIGYSQGFAQKWAWGIALYGNGGLNNNYPEEANAGHGTFFGGATSAKLQQVFVTPAVAYRIDPKWAVGLSLPIAYQTFSAKGLSHFAPFVADGNPDDLTDNGTDTALGVGGRLGVQYAPVSDVTLGLAYQTKIPGKLDDYSDLFAEQGNVDIPAVFVGGVAWKTDPNGVLAFDYQRIFYSSVPGIGNPLSNLKEYPPAQGGLGGDEGAGLGWSDCDVFKLGYQRKQNNSWTWRLGASYGNTPIDSEDVFFNILAPVTQEWHLTAGSTFELGDDQEITVAGVYTPENSVTGPNPFEAPGRQTITLSSHEFGLEVSYAKRL